jgi:hypothetical protein
MSLKASVLALFSISIFSTIGSAQSAPPLADAYTLKQQPNLNFGGQPILVVQPGVKSYLQFNLATLPPGATVSKATLRLYVDAVMSNGSFDVYQLTGSWGERTVTYNNAPGLGGSATGGHPIAVTSSARNQFVLIDVTPLVQAWVNDSEPNDGMALSLQGNNGAFAFDSKESTATSHQPELEIALTGSGGSQGPQGPAGPAGPTGPQGPVGAPGATGPQGLSGPIGPQGPTGANGTNGTNGAGFTFRNAFDPSAVYLVSDVVTFNGSSYIAIATNQGPNNPTPDQDPAAWTLLAQEGASGPAGAAGPAGTTGAAGPQGPVGALGLAGPQGLPGLSGPQGPAGTNGTNGIDGMSFNFRNAFDPTAAYAVNDVTTFTGSSYIAIVANQGPNNITPDQNPATWSLIARGGTGPAGPAGTQGPAGPAGIAGSPGAIGPIGPAGAPGPTGATGLQGPAGSTNVFYTRPLVGNTVLACCTDTILAQLSLPAGNYTFVATVEIETPGGGGFTCGLADPTHPGTIALSKVYQPAAIPEGVDLVQQVTLLGSTTLLQSTPNTIVVLECLPQNGNSYTVDTANILATQVTNLNVQ